MSLLHVSLRAATRLWEAAIILVVSVYFVLGVGLLAMRYVVLPNAQQFRPWVEQAATQALGLPVHIGSIETRWHGLMPQFSLHDVRIDGPHGHPALAFAAVDAAPSWKSLPRLSATFDQIVIRGATLSVSRPDPGHLDIGGIRFALGGTTKNPAAQQFADWLFEQGEVLILDSRLTWIDAARKAPPLPLSNVNMVLRNTLLTHRAALTATPPPDLGGTVDLRADFRQPLFLRHTADIARWTGTLYGSLPNADLATLQRQAPVHLPLQVGGGRGSVRAWIDVAKLEPTKVTADLALRDLNVQLASEAAPSRPVPAGSATTLPRPSVAGWRPLLPPLALRDFSGRITWAPRPGGERVTVASAQFHTAQGLGFGPVDGQWLWETANGTTQASLQTGTLDLGALGALAQRLPLPADWHARLAALQPHGRIDALTATGQWPAAAVSGLPASYTLHTRFTGLRWRSPAGAGARTPPGDPREVIDAGQAAAAALDLPANLPGVDGLSGSIDATQAGGSATLALSEGGLDLPLVYAPARLPLEAAQATLAWRRDRNGLWQIDANNFSFANADAAGLATLHWRGAAKGPGSIDLQGRLSRADARAVWRYLPIGIPLQTRDYLRSTIAAGSARQVDFAVKGPLADFPYDRPGTGTFRVSAQIEDGTFNYAPRNLLPPGETASTATVHANAAWPEFTHVAGQLVVTSNSLEVHNVSARAYGARLSAVNGALPSFRNGVLRVSGKAQAPASDALRYLVDSPVNRQLDDVFSGVRASGPLALDIDLRLPLDHLADATVKGRASLQGVDVAWSPDLPHFAGVRGTVDFSHRGFSLRLDAPNVLGGALDLTGGQQPGQPLSLLAKGSFTAAGLRTADQAWMQSLGKVVHGQSAYSLRIIQPAGGQAAGPTLELRSNLVGTSIDLPPPLGKPAVQSDTLVYTRTPLPGSSGTRQRSAVQINLGGDARARFIFDQPAMNAAQAAPTAVISGGIAIGPQATLPQPASGVQANVRLPVLDVDAWDAALKGLLDGKAQPAVPALFNAGGDQGIDALLPTTLSLDIGQLTLMHRVINSVLVGASRSGDLWQANVNSQQLSGYVGWQIGQGNNPGTLSARLTRLELPRSSDSDVERLLDEQPRSIPALDVVADNVDLHGHHFSRLEVQAVNRGRRAGTKEWRLTHFLLSSPDGVLTGSGNWTALGSQLTVPGSADSASPARRTAITFKLAISNAGGLLATLGKPGLIKGGQGDITGNLAWLGSPLNLDYPSMDGQFKLRLGSGQFLKADPGIAKLLGVLSLQSLPRRFTLDFSDLFSSGFTFDRVDADVTMNSGVATTRDFRMSGVSATVRMEGSADLAAETQKLRVVVVPNINAGAASLAYALVNPVVGLGTFLAQFVAREPLARAFTHVYDITGTWIDPTVKDVPLGTPAPDRTSVTP